MFLISFSSISVILLKQSSQTQSYLNYKNQKSITSIKNVLYINEKDVIDNIETYVEKYENFFHIQNMNEQS